VFCFYSALEISKKTKSVQIVFRARLNKGDLELWRIESGAGKGQNQLS
jgi:hypothetical protein